MAVSDNVVHSGTAADTTLASDITSGSTSLTLTSGTGFPSPAGGQIAYLVLAPGTAAEEVVSYTARSGANVTGVTRGLHGTSASSHVAGKTVRHQWTAGESDDVIKATLNTLGRITAIGDTLYADSTTTLARLAKGTSGQFLKQGASIPAWASLASADISDLAEFIRDTIGTALVAGSNVTLTVNDAGDTITVASGASAAFVGAKGNRATSAQSIPNNTWTAVEMNAETFDSNTFHDNSTNPSRFTVPATKAGKYHVIGRAEFAANATGRRILSISVNGTRNTFVELPPPGGTNAMAGEVNALLDLAVGDYVELQVFQTSGGALNVAIGAGTTDLALVLVGT